MLLASLNLGDHDETGVLGDRRQAPNVDVRGNKVQQTDARSGSANRLRKFMLGHRERAQERRQRSNRRTDVQSARTHGRPKRTTKRNTSDAGDDAETHYSQNLLPHSSSPSPTFGTRSWKPPKVDISRASTMLSPRELTHFKSQVPRAHAERETLEAHQRELLSWRADHVAELEKTEIPHIDASGAAFDEMLQSRRRFRGSAFDLLLSHRAKGSMLPLKLEEERGRSVHDDEAEKENLKSDSATKNSTSGWLCCKYCLSSRSQALDSRDFESVYNDSMARMDVAIPIAFAGMVLAMIAREINNGSSGEITTTVTALRSVVSILTAYLLYLLYSMFEDEWILTRMVHYPLTNYTMWSTEFTLRFLFECVLCGLHDPPFIDVDVDMRIPSYSSPIYVRNPWGMLIFLRLYLILRLMRRYYSGSTYRLLDVFAKRGLSVMTLVRNFISRQPIQVLGSAIFVAVLVLSYCLNVCERGGPSPLGAYENSLWYVIVTIPVIGYGEIAPMTTCGRVVVSIAAAIGIVLMTILVTSMYRQLYPSPVQARMISFLNIMKASNLYRNGAAEVIQSAWRASQMRRRMKLNNKSSSARVAPLVASEDVEMGQLERAPVMRVAFDSDDDDSSYSAPAEIAPYDAKAPPASCIPGVDALKSKLSELKLINTSTNFDQMSNLASHTVLDDTQYLRWQLEKLNLHVELLDAYDDEKSALLSDMELQTSTIVAAVSRMQTQAKTKVQLSRINEKLGDISNAIQILSSVVIRRHKEGSLCGSRPTSRIANRVTSRPQSRLSAAQDAPHVATVATTSANLPDPEPSAAAAVPQHADREANGGKSVLE
jgi:Ion channel